MGGQDNVETLVVLQPIAVDTASLDRTGMLVLANGKLVAILVRLEVPEHARCGAWFLEVGLGRLAGVRPPAFDTLEDATRWVRQHLKG
ncbi:hypothetical protein [Methylobacterium sp. J-076]|uniref:hypothetical protein n=1 Tax=Methylobacterium sp. J-076 TaxID=2836655 RepID=UPI001FBB0B3C|nr:hypothetical protein [Methylobacterium sp. J-076]MCJ2012204.1 hypothetical protein [Methylobacterium sp. J-076]